VTVDKTPAPGRVVGGVDTYKDLHVAAVVDEHDRLIDSRSFATTRQGYRQMLAWMRSLGRLDRVGVEATGTYGAGLLRHLEAAGVEVLEITAPDKTDRRRRFQSEQRTAPTSPHGGLMASLVLENELAVGYPTLQPQNVVCSAAKNPSAALKNPCSSTVSPALSGTNVCNQSAVSSDT
jgi:hypothetical protein